MPTNLKHLLWLTLQMKFLFGEPSIKKDHLAPPADSAPAESFLCKVWPLWPTGRRFLARERGLLALLPVPEPWL